MSHKITNQLARDVIDRFPEMEAAGDDSYFRQALRLLERIREEIIQDALPGSKDRAGPPDVGAG